MYLSDLSLTLLNDEKVAEHFAISFFSQFDRVLECNKLSYLKETSPVGSLLWSAVPGILLPCFQQSSDNQDPIPLSIEKDLDLYKLMDSALDLAGYIDDVFLNNRTLLIEILKAFYILHRLYLKSADLQIIKTCKSYKTPLSVPFCSYVFSSANKGKFDSYFHSILAHINTILLRILPGIHPKTSLLNIISVCETMTKAYVETCVRNGLHKQTGLNTQLLPASEIDLDHNDLWNNLMIPALSQCFSMQPRNNSDDNCIFPDISLAELYRDIQLFFCPDVVKQLLSALRYVATEAESQLYDEHSKPEGAVCRFLFLAHNTLLFLLSNPFSLHTYSFEIICENRWDVHAHKFAFFCFQWGYRELQRQLSSQRSAMADLKNIYDRYESVLCKIQNQAKELWTPFDIIFSSYNNDTLAFSAPQVLYLSPSSTQPLADIILRRGPCIYFEGPTVELGVERALGLVPYLRKVIYPNEIGYQLTPSLTVSSNLEIIQNNVETLFTQDITSPATMPSNILTQTMSSDLRRMRDGPLHHITLFHPITTPRLRTSILHLKPDNIFQRNSLVLDDITVDNLNDGPTISRSKKSKMLNDVVAKKRGDIYGTTSEWETTLTSIAVERQFRSDLLEKLPYLSTRTLILRGIGTAWKSAEISQEISQVSKTQRLPHAIFLVYEWPELTKMFKEYGVQNQDLHTTLFFEPEDVHGVSKGLETVRIPM